MPYDYEDDGPWIFLGEIEWEDVDLPDPPMFLQSAADESKFWALINATWTMDEEHDIEDLLVRIFDGE